MQKIILDYQIITIFALPKFQDKMNIITENITSRLLTWPPLRQEVQGVVTPVKRHNNDNTIY